MSQEDRVLSWSCSFGKMDKCYRGGSVAVLEALLRESS